MIHIQTPARTRVDEIPYYRIKRRNVNNMVSLVHDNLTPTRVPLAFLKCISEWMKTITDEERLFLGSNEAVPPHCETVIPMSISNQRAIHAHLETIPLDMKLWFLPGALDNMAPKAQNAWFYSYSTLYTDAFKNWVKKTVGMIEQGGARVFYVAPMPNSNMSHCKRGSALQPIRTISGHSGTVGLPKTHKCVKCNRVTRAMYFHMCSCAQHYADRCLRCKVVQLVLEGTLQTRLKGYSVIKDAISNASAFPKRGKCTGKCRDAFRISDLVCVVQKKLAISN